MVPLSLLSEWPVNKLSARWRVNGAEGHFGDQNHPYALASVTKPLFSLSVLVAIEEGTLSLDELVDSGAVGYQLDYPVTVRQLLSHSSGLAPTIDLAQTRPGTKRIYSNLGFAILGDLLASASGFTAAEYLSAAVTEPLGMSATVLDGSPAHGAESTVADLASFCQEMLSPTLIDPSTASDARRPQYPDLRGVLPGYGPMDPNPWGLGFEIRGDKTPHWTGPDFPPDVYGHFGQSGTFVWMHQPSSSYCVVLTDRDFARWALKPWSEFNARLTPHA